ncbi:MAG: rRNA maturation RNase YbeY [Ilumatobacteraceae bacterium]|jgi:probable rRNA maturation factor
MVGFFARRARARRVGGDGSVQIFCADEQNDFSVDVDRWRRLAAHVLVAEGVRGAAELSVLFVDETTIAEMNKVHMGKDGPTDVLAFPIDSVVADESPGPGRVSRGPDRPEIDADDYPLLLGDIVVCPAVANRQAPTHAGNIDDELALLVTHGVLHVLGYDHADDDQRIAMQRRETALLEEFHWGRPAPTGFRIDHPEDGAVK